MMLMELRALEEVAHETGRMTDGMKTITLHIPGEIYRDLKQAMHIRLLSGCAAGLPDAFLKRLIDVLEEGKVEHQFSYPQKAAGKPSDTP